VFRSGPQTGRLWFVSFTPHSICEVAA
jgi:hypothetical protein